MADLIELKYLIKDFLNTNLIDPLPSRRGFQFYVDSDDFNYSRKDTFPKGYIEGEYLPGPTQSSLGNEGYARRDGQITIFYYNVTGGKYNNGTRTLSDADVSNYMTNLVYQALRNKKFIGYHVTPSSFEEITNEDPINTGTFTLHSSRLTITYYWYEQYRATYT